MTTYLGTFYLTDFLAHHFDGLVWKGLGIDRHPELLPSTLAITPICFISASRLNRMPPHGPRAAADKLGLRYVEIDTGLDVLEQRLVAIVRARAGQTSVMPT